MTRVKLPTRTTAKTTEIVGRIPKVERGIRTTTPAAETTSIVEMTWGDVRTYEAETQALFDRMAASEGAPKSLASISGTELQALMPPPRPLGQQLWRGIVRLTRSLAEPFIDGAHTFALGNQFGLFFPGGSGGSGDGDKGVTLEGGEGLLLAYREIEGRGGSIRFDVHPDGNTFYIQLPPQETIVPEQSQTSTSIRLDEAIRDILKKYTDLYSQILQIELPPQELIATTDIYTVVMQVTDRFEEVIEQVQALAEILRSLDVESLEYNILANKIHALKSLYQSPASDLSSLKYSLRRVVERIDVSENYLSAVDELADLKTKSPANLDKVYVLDAIYEFGKGQDVIPVFESETMAAEGGLPEWLFPTIQNLITNANKYRDVGREPVLTFHFDPKTRLLTIRNNALPIPPEVAAKIGKERIVSE